MRPLTFAALLLALGLSACASSPNPTYYTLAPVPGAPQHAQGVPGPVELRRIGLAGYLDRAEIVRADSGYRLRLAHNDLWGEPLGDMIGRVLAQDLTQRLPGIAVISEAGAISAGGDRIVEVDIQRFDADRSGDVVLLAQTSVRRRGVEGSGLTRTVQFDVRPAGAGADALVAAMSAALGQLADSIAVQLQALPPAPSASAPGV